MCGENLRAQSTRPEVCGSPPRVRGKPGALEICVVGGRITPACAGKTGRKRHERGAYADHPRVCGENDRMNDNRTRVKGSPPRVRGKPNIGIFCHSSRRITPACAGKTLCACRLHRKISDHPRVCGENPSARIDLGVTLGSPPRVRGKLRTVAIQDGRGRITPACAGKTLRKWRISVVDPSPQPRSSLTSRRAGASIGSQRAPCAAPV